MQAPPPTLVESLGTQQQQLADAVEGIAPPASIARGFRVSWSTVWSAVEREGSQRVDDPARMGPASMVGFDETGMSPASRRRRLAEVAIVVDPFHIVRLANDAVTRCRQRVQQDTVGHRGGKGASSPPWSTWAAASCSTCSRARRQGPAGVDGSYARSLAGHDRCRVRRSSRGLPGWRGQGRPDHRTATTGRPSPRVRTTALQGCVIAPLAAAQERFAETLR